MFKRRKKTTWKAGSKVGKMIDQMAEQMAEQRVVWMGTPKAGVMALLMAAVRVFYWACMRVACNCTS